MIDWNKYSPTEQMALFIIIVGLLIYFFCVFVGFVNFILIMIVLVILIILIILIILVLLANPLIWIPLMFLVD